MADMDQWTKNGQLCSFADDTSDVVVNKALNEVVKRLEQDSEGIIKFMSSNNLVINPGKTGFLIYGREEEPVQICIGGDNVISRNVETLLGMKLCADLTWSEHTKALFKMLRQRIGIIQRIKHKVPKITLRVIADGIFNSLIRYGIALYCKPKLKATDNSNAVLDELQVIHNDMQRIILGYKWKDQIKRERIWEETGMMTVNHMMSYHILMETYNIVRCGASETINEVLRESERSTHVTTRIQTRGDLFVPDNCDKWNGFSYYGAKLWNQLPVSLRESKTDMSFKTGVKEWLKLNIPYY
jgi:hypothetical protein